MPGAAAENTLQITYNDFVTVLFTVATFMLGAVAVGVGVVAAYTIGSLRDEARNTAGREARAAAEKYAEKAVRAATENLPEKVAAIAFGASRVLHDHDDLDDNGDEER